MRIKLTQQNHNVKVVEAVDELVIVGTATKNKIVGGGGDEVLRGKGKSGADSLKGGADSLKGGAGDDIMEGGDGADLLAGGRGDDALTGGGGADVFVFRPGAGSDVITDFAQSQDLIWANGVKGFADLFIAQSGDHVTIAYANVSITVESSDAAVFGGEDFIFA